MTDPIRDALVEAKSYAKQYLRECAAELIEWQDTSVLKDGHVRELARICARVAEAHTLSMAENLINRQTRVVSGRLAGRVQSFWYLIDGGLQ